MNIIEIHNKFPDELNAEFVYKYNNRNNNGKMFSEMMKKLINPITL